MLNIAVTVTNIRLLNFKLVHLSDEQLVSSKTDSEMKLCMYKLHTHMKIFISNIFTDVSGKPIGPILKGQTFQKDP